VVVVIGDDIDPSNLGEKWWAIGMRYQPDRGTDILNRSRCSRSIPPPYGREELYPRILIDATIPSVGRKTD
jgi:UbiD family decarboxylase